MVCKSFILSYLAVSSPLFASVTAAKIYGWPLSEKSFEDILTNQDALMGSMVCPALTRLNLEKGKSEGLLLSSIKEDESGRVWELQLNKNRQFWGKKPITVGDLAEFIQSELAKTVTEVFSDSVITPSFQLEAKDDSLKIIFSTAPKFGPYILSRVPFYRKTNQGILCAGSLMARQEKESILLESQDKGATKDFELVREKLTTKDSTYLSFQFGNEIHPDSWERQIEEEITCPSVVEMPLLTVVAWNPKGKYTSNEEFRKAMTSILPRGALLRAGAGSLGDLLSAPILRTHPGYKKSLLVLPYDLKKADAILNSMNLLRSEKDGYRRVANDEVLEIKLAIDPSPNTSLLKKILDDSFRALGMRLHLVARREEADGILTGIELSWPENDLTPLLHSQKSSQAWPWAYSSPELDQALDAYNLSLTREKPDFSLLANVHERFSKLEPFSVLVGHKSCMQYGKGTKPGPKIVNTRNPDWMKAAISR